MASSDYDSPTLECDLVMKGGVTSGIVYPPAVLVLARRYRFRCIGGSSAGAIAAAVTAAAEYGRAEGGFEKLQQRSAWLARDGNLLGLFQASPATRPLMDTLFAAAELRKQGASAASALLRLAPRIIHLDQGGGLAKGLLGGGVAAAGLAHAFAGSLRGRGLLPAVLLAGSGALAGGMAGGFAHLWQIATRTLPEHFYGLCAGRPEPGYPSGSEALTDWLHASINDLAGRSFAEPPLTFRDLHAKQITLKMMTTNLNHSRPYHLPLQDNVFIFEAGEMRQLFPHSVVEHMIAHAHKTERVSLAGMPGFHFLPVGEDLPVVVAARLSLSFPVLLSAIPLYTIRTAAFRKPQIERDDLQRNWFSDGGISSNFPIHFFDAWLPDRPTFGITLSTLPPEVLTRDRGETRVKDEYTSALTPGAEIDYESAERSTVYLPRANKPLYPIWEPIDGLWHFLNAIFTTAQSHRDNTQSMLPSYRDRVVQVELADDEGGLNLAMTPETIRRVEEKGRQAGETLLHDFDFDHHRWVRFQVLMAELEAQLHAMTEAYGEAGYRELLDSVSSTPAYPYARTRPWIAEALRRLEGLHALVEHWAEKDRAWQENHPAWQGRPFFDQDSPRPEPVLRVTPDL